LFSFDSFILLVCDENESALVGADEHSSNLTMTTYLSKRNDCDCETDERLQRIRENGRLLFHDSTDEYSWMLTQKRNRAFYAERSTDGVLAMDEQTMDKRCLLRQRILEIASLQAHDGTDEYSWMLLRPNKLAIYAEQKH